MEDLQKNLRLWNARCKWRWRWRNSNYSTNKDSTTPAAPPAAQVIEIVEDEEEVEESIIESTETDNDKIIEVDDVCIEEDDLDVDVPFAVIEDVPIFPGCENVSNTKDAIVFKKK